MTEHGFNYGFSSNIGIKDDGFVEKPEGRLYQVSLDIEDMHLNGYGVLHGGVIATLMDACQARVFFLNLPGQNPDNPIGGVTAEMKITYIKPVKKGYVYALGTLLRQGKRTAFTEGALYNEDDELVAKASATLMMTQKKN